MWREWARLGRRLLRRCKPRHSQSTNLRQRGSSGTRHGAMRRWENFARHRGMHGRPRTSAAAQRHCGADSERIFRLENWKVTGPRWPRSGTRLVTRGAVPEWGIPVHISRVRSPCTGNTGNWLLVRSLAGMSFESTTLVAPANYNDYGLNESTVN